MPDRLTELEQQSIYILREAYARSHRLGLLWSVGKDSTVLLWMCRKAFLGRIPFPVIHIDTSYKFPQMYALRDRLAREWDLDLVVMRNEEALAAGMNPQQAGPLACCHALKTVPLMRVQAELNLEMLLVGIRRDEHGVRAKERYFSPRDESAAWHYTDQPAELWDLYSASNHSGAMRVHPLLHFSESDIWRYVEREKIPLVDLYFASAGQRYRSLGCQRCCQPIDSAATDVEAILQELQSSTDAERAGRTAAKEDPLLMQKLRALGYM